jgi:formylglycine-generating enzyme required for sulfatase activity
MDFIAGKDLKELLEEHGDPFPVDKVLDWANQLLDVLAYLHSQAEPVIHRDIKPANIKLTPKGKVILLDFGLAKGATISLLMSLPAATIAYAPLEQVLARGTDCRSDIYSLGATLFHLMTGELPPFALQRKDALWKGSPDPLVRADHINPHIPVRVADALTRAMSLQSDDRPQTADQMRELLRGATAVTVSSDVKPVEPARPPDPLPDVYRTAKSNENLETLLYQSIQSVEPKADVSPPRITAPEPVPSAKVLSSNRKEPGRSARKVWLAVTGVLAIVALAILMIWVLRSKETGSVATPPATPSTREFEFETISLDAKGAVTNRSKGRAKSFTEDLGNGVTIEMVEIPAGDFLMGSPYNEKDGGSGEDPVHGVDVQTFYMSKFEVTQAQWRAVAGLPKDYTDLNPDPSQFKGDDNPVEQVSWWEVMEFCTRLSRKTGATYRLPTEAEWEYACRGSTMMEFFLVNPFAFGKTITPEWVNYNGSYPYADGPKGESRNQTVKVGSFGVANGFGLYDMHGNVWEWCGDWYLHNYYSQSPDADPTGPDRGSRRVVRGGSWGEGAMRCRSAYRGWYVPSVRGSTLGFRLVRTLR